MATLAMSACGLTGSSDAATLSIPLNARLSMDGLGDPDNVIVTFDIGPGSLVTGVGWTNAVLETGPGGTWGSHARIRLSDAAQAQHVDVLIFDGGDSPNLWGPETAPVSGLGSPPGGQNGPELFGSEFNVDASGLLRVEFWESVDNNPNALDSIWVAGALMIEYRTQCLGDIDGCGTVDVNDVLAVIQDWGECPSPPEECPADVAPNGPGKTGDGQVNVDDLLTVLNAWGPCS